MKKALFGKKIKDEVILQISKAQSKIILAMAWISDKDIIRLFSQKANEGVKISIILSSESNQIVASQLEKIGYGNISVHILGKSKENLMHHKFCVIDEAILITGSYNFTSNAIGNDENILVIDEDSVLIWSYIDEFSRLLSNFRSTPLSAIKEEFHSNIDVSLLGDVLKDAKGRYYFQLEKTKLFLAQDANPLQLKGEIIIVSGKKNTLISNENPSGEWELAVIK
jgi:phosphatidylserine/phosphatidylglycerophosphate/cardiolipin synthase-like enzyme